MRLHVELRCCMDCATLLPNSTFSGNSETSEHVHKCSELISSQAKDDPQTLSVNTSHISTSSYETVDLPIPSELSFFLSSWIR
ncbi:unnamed protein product [Trichobilharzia regenti]|nr:unnamed protein product [Trichobilharzia regenti]